MSDFLDREAMDMDRVSDSTGTCTSSEEIEFLVSSARKRGKRRVLSDSEPEDEEARKKRRKNGSVLMTQLKKKNKPAPGITGR
jgi:hypothetical protein